MLDAHGLLSQVCAVVNRKGCYGKAEGRKDRHLTLSSGDRISAGACHSRLVF